MTNTLSFPFPTSASMPNDSLLARSGSRRRSSAMSATSVVGRAETNDVDQQRAPDGQKKFSRTDGETACVFFLLLITVPSTRGGVEGPAMSAAEADVSRRRVRAVIAKARVKGEDGRDQVAMRSL